MSSPQPEKNKGGKPTVGPRLYRPRRGEGRKPYGTKLWFSNLYTSDPYRQSSHRPESGSVENGCSPRFPVVLQRRQLSGADCTSASTSAACSSGTRQPLAPASHLPPSSLILSFTGYVFPTIRVVSGRPRCSSFSCSPSLLLLCKFITNKTKCQGPRARSRD